MGSSPSTCSSMEEERYSAMSFVSLPSPAHFLGARKYEENLLYVLFVFCYIIERLNF